MLIDTLSYNTGIPAFDLVEAKKGKNGGSWIHPDLGIQLAHSSSEWMDKNLIFYWKSGNKNKTTKGKKERNWVQRPENKIIGKQMSQATKACYISRA